MEIEKRKNGWWITDLPDGPDCGPYDRKTDGECRTGHIPGQEALDHFSRGTAIRTGCQLASLSIRRFRYGKEETAREPPTSQ